MSRDNLFRLDLSLEERIKKFITNNEDFKYGSRNVSFFDDFSVTRFKIGNVESNVLRARFTDPGYAKAKKIIENQFPGVVIKRIGSDSYAICRDPRSKIGTGEVAHPEVKKKLERAAEKKGQTRFVVRGVVKPVTLKELKSMVTSFRIGKASEVTAKTREKWLKAVLVELERITGETPKIKKEATLMVDEVTGYAAGDKFIVVEREKKTKKITVPFDESIVITTSKHDASPGETVKLDVDVPTWTAGVGWHQTVARAKAMIDRIRVSLR